MRFPKAFAEGKVGKCSAEGGILRAARIDAEGDLARRGGHMADAHLAEADAVRRAFDAKIVLAAAEAVPHALDRGVDGRRRPVGVPAHSHDAAEVLELLVLIFDRGFKPVFAVDVQRDAALVKALLAFKPRPHGKGEKLLRRAHLQDGRAVVAEVVIRPLPQIGVRRRHDLDLVLADGIVLRRARPAHLFQIHAVSPFPISLFYVGRKNSPSPRHRLCFLPSFRAESGIDPNVCQSLAGHSDVKITLGIYMHASTQFRKSEYGKFRIEPI